jgi:hypothetical protein
MVDKKHWVSKAKIRQQIKHLRKVKERCGTTSQRHYNNLIFYLGDLLNDE